MLLVVFSGYRPHHNWRQLCCNARDRHQVSQWLFQPFGCGTGVAENVAILSCLPGRALFAPILNGKAHIFANPVLGVCG